MFGLDDLPVRPASFFPRIWRPALKTAELPQTTRFHDLNHYYASLLIRHGESVKTVQTREAVDTVLGAVALADSVWTSDNR